MMGLRRSINTRGRERGTASAPEFLRLTLLAPAVVANLIANPDVVVNLESVLRRVMPLDWQAQRAVFAGR